MPDTDKKPRSRRRLFRRVATALCVLLVVAGLGVFLLTRSFILTPLVTPRIADQLGADVSIGNVSVTGRRSAVLEDVVIRARGIDGEAGEVLRIGRVTVSADLLGLLTGRAGPMTMEFTDPRFRISEDTTNPNNFNFMALGSGESSGRPSGALAVVINSGLVEMGEHGVAGYHTIGSLPVSGSLHTMAGEDWLVFDFVEASTDGTPMLESGLKTKGRINLRTFAVDGSVEGLVLDARSKSLAPLTIRSWWERMELDGTVADAAVFFDPAGESVAWITVKDVGITIPLERSGIWKRYSAGEVSDSTGLPRMRVGSGRIEMREDRIVLEDLHGLVTNSEGDVQVAAVPYRVAGTIGMPAGLDWADREHWMKSVLDRASLDLTFHLDEFRLRDEEGAEDTAVELPAVVTDVLTMFKVRGCTLYTGVHVQRDAAPAATEGRDGQRQPIRSSGWAIMSDGVGAYGRFPYPLEGVNAELSFTDQRLDVVSLVGNGAHGGRVSIKGHISPPNKWPFVALTISATDVPLDDALREAMPAQYQTVIDALMHRPSFDRLKDLGVLPDEASAAVAEAEITRLTEQAAAARSLSDPSENDVERLKRVDRRIAALERARAMRDFEPGGRVDLELRIDRTEGRGQKTRTTGDIIIKSANLVLDHFPYPFTAHSGVIGIEQDRVTVRSMLGTAIGGGQVLLDGDIRTPRGPDGKLHVELGLEVGVIDDLINPALMATIPIAGKGAADQDSGLARAGRLLEAAGLEGLLQYQGRVLTTAEGDVDWNIAAIIEDGRAVPDDRMTRAIRDIGLFWPAGFALTNVEGSFLITRDSINLARITGRRGEGAVAATGTIGLGAKGQESDVTVDFTDFALEEYLLNLFPGQGAAKMTEVWRRYEPRGAFDATLRYHSRGDVVDPLALTVRPNRVWLTLGGRPVSLAGREDGASITLGGNRIEFSNLQLELESDGLSDGIAALSGAYGLEGDLGNLRLEGWIVGSRFESPWVAEAVRLLGRDDVTSWYDQLEPVGVFDADLSFATGAAGAAPDGEVEVRPSTVAFNMGAARVAAVLEPGASLRLSPHAVRLDACAGTFEGGATFSVAGELRPSAPMRGEFQVSYRGAGQGGEGLAFLPPSVVDGFRAISLSFDEGVFINNARLVLEQVEEAGAATTWESGWRRTFTGPIEMQDASFDVGLGFTGADGRIDARIETSPGKPAKVRLNMTATELFAKNRRLTDAEALIVLSDDGSALSLPMFRADLYGGAVTASARVDLGPTGSYEVCADAAAVNLRDLTLAADSPESPPPPETSPTAEGVMYAHVALGGVRGDPSQRRGRAGLRIVEGKIANNPITLPLLQLSQLTIPMDASLDYADVSAFIEGDKVIAERVFLEGGSVTLAGEGTMTLPNLDLDLRLRSRGRVFGFSALVGVVSDQLYAIHVTGPLAETKARLVPIPGLTDFFDHEWRDRSGAAPTVQSSTPDNSGESGGPGEGSS